MAGDWRLGDRDGLLGSGALDRLAWAHPLAWLAASHHLTGIVDVGGAGPGARARVQGRSAVGPVAFSEQYVSCSVVGLSEARIGNGGAQFGTPAFIGVA